MYLIKSAFLILPFSYTSVNAYTNIFDDIADKYCVRSLLFSQMILIYRYIDWLSWIEIANKIYCSLASVYRKHNEALEKLIVPES